MFDAGTHSAKKFVLHTNYPGHYNFNMYADFYVLQLTVVHKFRGCYLSVSVAFAIVKSFHRGLKCFIMVNLVSCGKTIRLINHGSTSVGRIIH